MSKNETENEVFLNIDLNNNNISNQCEKLLQKIFSIKKVKKKIINKFNKIFI